VPVKVAIVVEAVGSSVDTGGIVTCGALVTSSVVNEPCDEDGRVEAVVSPVVPGANVVVPSVFAGDDVSKGVLVVSWRAVTSADEATDIVLMLLVCVAVVELTADSVESDDAASVD